MTRGTDKSPRLRIGALLPIAALMIGSAVLRFGAATAPAIARELDAGRTEASTNSEPAETQRANAAPDEAELGRLLAALQERDRALADRERRLEDRLKALSVADAAVTRKLRELGEAEERLKATLALADGAAEGDLSRLTDVYAQMKPKQAASLFEQMEPRFAAGFLARMRPDAAAGIMAGMAPQAAYAVSVVMAGRNAEAPTE